MQNRLERLRTVMQERELEALFISRAANRLYVSGFSGSTGALLVTQTGAWLFTDFRYRIQAAQEAAIFELCEISVDLPLHRRLAEMVCELGLAQIAFESNHVSVAEHTRLVQALHEYVGAVSASSGSQQIPTLTPVEGVVETLREVKQADELATLRRAIAITDAALEATLPRLRPDQTEREVAWMLEVAMRERGADSIAFAIIVAAGPNAARPHAHPGDEQLGTGRPIIIDMGARVDGYHADLTRTIVLGEPDARFRMIYALVRAAQQRAIAGVRAGMATFEVDRLARDYIAAAGYADNFGHGLGHGVGLDIHEGPSLRRRPPDQTDAPPAILQAGNVFSIEPGIYLEDWGGVRIEDLVLLGETGAEVLSQARYA